MKKLIFVFAILFGTMFVSCNTKSSEVSTEATDSVEVVDTVVADTVAVDTVVTDTMCTHINR